MSENIYINVTSHETRVAMVQQGALQELHIERTLTRGLVSNVYLGKVVRVLPGMQSAFIDIGLERAAFLHVADIWEYRQQNQHLQAVNSTPTPIEKILYESQKLVVQVIKDPIGTKGARLSTQISIAGRMLVYLPQDTHIGISQKIESGEDRELLRQRITQLRPTNETGGFIVRTMADEASDADLLADMHYLHTRWSEIQTASRTPGHVQLLYQDLSLSQRVLRDFACERTQSVQVDAPEAFSALQKFAETYIPGMLPRLTHYSGERPLFDLHHIEEEIERALGRRVDLKSGGYLMIDQTEAMTTIDVNTGGYVGARNFDDTIFKTNLEAAHAIARQLRLRNLGGIIILDFIDMEHTEHRNAVLNELRKALAQDRTKVTVNGFSPLGLVELTRKRTRESLAHILCERCPICEGRGEIKTARTVCYEILREIDREAKQFNPKEFRILASQNVIDMFLEEESQHLAQLGDAIRKPISLRVETLYSQQQYDIILM